MPYNNVDYFAIEISDDAESLHQIGTFPSVCKLWWHKIKHVMCLYKSCPHCLILCNISFSLELSEGADIPPPVDVPQPSQSTGRFFYQQVQNYNIA